jgi:hypothetical protein
MKEESQSQELAWLRVAHYLHQDEAVFQVNEHAVESKLQKRGENGGVRAYEERGRKEDDEGVIVVGTDAVKSHGAVVVVTDAASIANAAVVHTTELVNLASLTVTPTLNSMKG